MKEREGDVCGYISSRVWTMECVDHGVGRLKVRAAEIFTQETWFRGTPKGSPLKSLEGSTDPREEASEDALNAGKRC